MVKGCPSRSKCKNCNGRHPTCLHGEFTALNSTDFRKSHETKGPRAENPDGTISGRKPEPEAKRAISEIVLHRTLGEPGESKFSMIIPELLSSKTKPDDEQLVYALFRNRE